MTALTSALAMAVLALLCAPVVTTMVVVHTRSGVLQAAGAAISLAYAAGLWWWSIGWASGTLAAREPEVLAIVSSRAG
jgi:hypothetical protein